MNEQVMPTLQQWHSLESNRLLLEPRKQVLSIIFRLLATAALVFDAPLIVVAIWATLVFGANAWLRHLIVAYRASSLANSSQIMTSEMSRIVHHYKMVWMANSFVWTCLSFISQIWLPLSHRLICLAILNALMFLSLTRTYVDRVLMHKVSAIFIAFQLLFLAIIFAIYPADEVVAERLKIYILYLLLMSYLLWSVGNRFNQMHVQHLNADYIKMQLIENLNQSQIQLNLEQQALTASNKLVQQFYSGAAHDLRQPVYAMQLYTTMLSEDASQHQLLLPKITKSCIAINDMFNTLFDYQQTHMHDTELVERDINIQETFKSLALQFQPIAAGKGLEIRFKPIPGSINMVPLYLARILSNLIANALRYTNKGGVLVTAKTTRKSLRFEIWDTGIGIDESNKQKIFNEFYKVNNKNIKNNDANYDTQKTDNIQTTNSAELKDERSIKEGLGLGLAIVKQLSSCLEQTDITVKSRVGRGSVFIFTVPLERYIAV